MIEQLYPYLILTGCTIGAVLLYLLFEARRASSINLALIQLNEQHHFDTPTFLRAAWEQLARAGFRGIAWKLDWFGVPIAEQAGTLSGQAVSRDIQVGDMRVVVTLYLQDNHGERQYFNTSLMETFFLLLRTDMVMKVGATHTTLHQMAKLNLFLQHDMKNIAQFIQFTADYLQHAPKGSEQQVLQYLRTATPVMRERADRVVRTLTGGQPQNNPLRHYCLQEEIQQACHLHQLDGRITGAADVIVPSYTLDSVLDNLLKNYHDFAPLPTNPASHTPIWPVVHIGITESCEGVEMRFESEQPAPDTPLERIFEPFWSSNPDGLGIGLYQAKLLLEADGGKLSVARHDSGTLQFLVNLPHKCLAPGSLYKN
jgi:signal transduction histidine kinase